MSMTLGASLGQAPLAPSSPQGRWKRVPLICERQGALAWSRIVSRHEFPSMSDPSMDNEMPQAIYHANTQAVPPVFLCVPA